MRHNSKNTTCFKTVSTKSKMKLVTTSLYSSLLLLGFTLLPAAEAVASASKWDVKVYDAQSDLYLNQKLNHKVTNKAGDRNNKNNQSDDQSEDSDNDSNNSESSKKGIDLLSTYSDLVKSLNKIKSKSKVPLKVGPLIQNQNNGGLVNINIPLDQSLEINTDVCGPTATPTIRQAVICTLGLDSINRGNLNPNKVGFSNHNRAILAAQIGNPNGIKVYIITQQHGPEVASTEAALTILKTLSKSKSKWAKKVLSELNILFVIRANPDGGEPDPVNCSFDLPVGMPYFGNCALSRQNLDPKAGGGYQVLTSESNFFGVVGHGYNMNRYNFVGLDSPIRPVENQALVAAGIAFRPDIVLDLHGDSPKSDCKLNFSTLVIEPAFGLPIIECINPDLPSDFRLFSVFVDTSANQSNRFYSRSLNAKLMETINSQFIGTAGRFSQIQLGSGVVNDGTVNAYEKLGAITGGWETTNFAPAV